MHKLVWFTLCIVIFICSSCSKETCQPQEMVNILRYYPTPDPPCVEASQLIYYDRLKPKPLTQDQIDTLSKVACLTRLDHVWFARVLFNYQDILTADIYFLPETSSPRIRKGVTIHYDADSYLCLKKNLDEEVAALDTFEPHYEEYVQVFAC